MTVQGHGWDDNVGYPAFRNVIINGGMSVAQRNTSVASLSAGSGYNTADRWAASYVGGTWTQSVENDAPTGSGHRKSLKMLCTTAKSTLVTSDRVIIQQNIEGQNMQHFAKGTSSAKSFTISFWVKSNVTGTYVCELVDNDNARGISQTYTVSASGVWEKKTLTYVADTTGVLDNDNGLSFFVRFWLASGPDFTSSPLNTIWSSSSNLATGQVNLAAATNNYWQITGVQLEAGPVATPFEFEPFETTLRKCMRYYQVVPFTSSAYNSGEMTGAIFRVPLRTTPSGSFILYPSMNGTGTANQLVRPGIGNYSVGTGSASGYTTEGVVSLYASGLIANAYYGGSFYISAEL
jgi:hypothetical protein